MDKKKKKIKIIFYFLIACMLLTAVNAFTTNANGKTFDFAVTSGKNAKLSGASFATYIIVGDTAGSLNSSSFKTKTGFLGTAGYLNGESCQKDIECAGGFCCSSACQSSSCPVSQAAPAAAAEGGGSAFPLPVQPPDNSYTHFFDSIKAGQNVTIILNKYPLPITKIEFTLKESLSDVSLSIVPVDMPQSIVQDSIQYFEILSNKINSGNLASFVIYFKVGIKSGYIKETVSLNRFDGQWVKLPTMLISEDNEYYYYKSSTQIFSLFAVTGSKYLPTVIKQEITNITNVTAQEGKNVSVISQIIPQEAARREASLKRTLLMFGVFAWLVILAVLVIYMLPKLRLHHIKMVYKKFNDLLFQANAYLVSNDIYDASKIYEKLLKIYIDFIHYPINGKIKIEMCIKIEQIYDQIIRMRNGGFKI